MKNHFLLLLALAALLLAGCGNKESPSVAPVPAGDREASDPETEEAPADVDGEVPQW